VDSVAGVKIRTRGAESLFGGPSPAYSGPLFQLESFVGANVGFLSLASSPQNYIDVLFPCEYSGAYDRTYIMVQTVSGSPTARVQIFAADSDGKATGPVLGSGTATGMGGGQTYLVPLTNNAQLTAGKLYVARYDCTAATSWEIGTTASKRGDCGNGNWGSWGSAYDASGNLLGCGPTPFAIATTDNRWFGQTLGYAYPTPQDMYDTGTNCTRAGFGHTPTTDRVVYEIHAGNVRGYGAYAQMNDVSAYIYEFRNPNWVEVYKSGGKKSGTTSLFSRLSWAIPNGFMLKRNTEYVVAVGPTAPNSGDSSNKMQVWMNVSSQVFPPGVNVGQYGGIGEEKMWPAYYTGALPVAFSKSTTGTNLKVADVGYCYRVMPTVILP
jgi:hypothetical protein